MIEKLIDFINGFAEPIRVLSLGMALFMWYDRKILISSEAHVLLIVVIIFMNKKGHKNEKD